MNNNNDLVGHIIEKVKAQNPGVEFPRGERGLRLILHPDCYDRLCDSLGKQAESAGILTANSLYQELKARGEFQDVSRPALWVVRGTDADWNV
jgi:hypothetical protein